ncbi:hypothetical protein KKA14_05085, partial [bacterium]|nr:hypothetical protein [bacterium]
MTKIPDKLQGTDGIRGRITSDDDLNGLTALDYFEVSGKLTPSFFEHYAYAYATLLIETKTGNSDDSIVVGWDPRDREGIFNEVAVNGIRKAGLNVIKVGILPTPAIPLYMLLTQSAGSMVLTASHNPSDQNGIKLFHGYTALKFLPSDDEMLTAVVKKQCALDLRGIPLLGTLEDHSREARDLFVSFSIDPENSWMKETDFPETILVIDASKGAVSGVVEEIFSNFA